MFLPTIMAKCAKDPGYTLINLVQGESSRAVELRVRVLNIVLFPVSVAANFVTLSWNTSQSLARDYLLQVHAAPTARCADPAYRQYNNIEVSGEP